MASSDYEREENLKQFDFLQWTVIKRRRLSNEAYHGYTFVVKIQVIHADILC